MSTVELHYTQILELVSGLSSKKSDTYYTVGCDLHTSDILHTVCIYV